MRNRVSIATSGLRIFCALLLAQTAAAQHNAPPGGPAQQNGARPSDAPLTYHYFCVAEVKPPTPTYISPIVQRSVGARGLEAGAAEENLKKSFGDFLARKYGYAGTLSCLGQPSRSWMESYRQKRIDVLQSSNYRVVEGDWTDPQATGSPVAPSHPATTSASAAGTSAAGGSTPTPAATATPPGPPANTANKAAPPSARGGPGGATLAPGHQSAHAVCWTESTGPTAYFSAAFETGKPDYAAWKKAFADTLVKQYGFKGAVRCSVSANLADAQVNQRGLMNALRATRKIVETG